MVEPSASRPTGVWLVGAASSTGCEPSSEVCASLAIEFDGNFTLRSSANLTAAKKLPSGRCLASIPDTLPTVTSSTMTGEFCGSVATSAKSTVIEYEPGPWPAVPGSATEFSPPNWQPASSALPPTNALPRNQIRLIVRPPARQAAVQRAPIRPAADLAADRMAPSGTQGRAARRAGHGSVRAAGPTRPEGPGA